LVGPHQVHPGEELVGGGDAHQILAGDLEEPGQTGSDPDEHGVMGLEELVEGLGHPDRDVGLEVDAERAKPVDLGGHDRLGQPVLRNPVHEHPAQFVQGLEHRHLVAHVSQVTGAGQTGGAAADHRHPTARSHLGGRRPIQSVLAYEVSDESLQVTDGDGAFLLGEDACPLALVLLGAHPPTHGGEGVVGLDHSGGGPEVAIGDMGDEPVDTDPDRASLNALRPGTLQAPFRLEDRQLGGVAQVHLVEGGRPGDRIALGHPHPLTRHPLLA
jgi:hypothetical protein